MRNFVVRSPVMRRPKIFLVLGVMLACSATAGTAQPEHSPNNYRRVEALRDELRQVVIGARDRVFPALVHIEVVTSRFVQGTEVRGRSGGSGAIISEDGYVVTNYHVIRNGERFKCTLTDRTEAPAKLIGSDPLTDLAVLKLDLGGLAADKIMPVATFGDSNLLEAGDYVLAMGSPFTLSRSISLGIISNTARVFGPGVGGGDLGGIELDLGERTGLFTRWIQHDAALNPGNSGGPLVDLEGNIVGVNQLGGDGIGFAIPSSLAESIVADLIENGRVPRSWIGIHFKPLSGTTLDKGALVYSVDPGGPADRAGIRAGDVLLSLDNDPVTARHLEEIPLLLRQIADFPVGNKVVLELARDTSFTQVRLTTEEFQRDRGDQKSLKEWGLVVQEITQKAVTDFMLNDTSGVLITGIRPGLGAALAEPKLALGDVIQAVGERAISSLVDLVSEYERLTGSTSPTEALVLRIDRRGRSYLSILRPARPLRVDRSWEVPKPWLGLATQPVTLELAKLIGKSGLHGFRVTQVYQESTAAKADLQVGDVIKSINGIPLEPRGNEDAGLFNRRIQAFDVGEVVTLGLVRGSSERATKVALEEPQARPSVVPRHNSVDLEMTIREVTFFDRYENRWDREITGVLVEYAEGAGRARLAGVRSNDLVQKIGPYTINDIDSYQKAIERLKEEQPEIISVIVRRGNRTFLSYLEPNW